MRIIDINGDLKPLFEPPEIKYWNEGKEIKLDTKFEYKQDTVTERNSDTFNSVNTFKVFTESGDDSNE